MKTTEEWHKSPVSAPLTALGALFVVSSKYLQHFPLRNYDEMCAYNHLQVNVDDSTRNEWFSCTKALTLWQISVVAAWTAPVMVSCWRSMGNGRAPGTPWKRFPADAAVARA